MTTRIAFNTRTVLIAVALILGGVVAAVGLHMTGVEEQRARERAIAAGYIVIPGDPSIGMPDTYVLPEAGR
jgi:hypothetical protein